MNERVFLDLPLENNQTFFYRDAPLGDIKKELDDFLVNNASMQTKEFTKKVLFSHELQANNQVEGYGDDIALIDDIIKRKIRKIKDVKKKQRIINLYHGYQFILKYKKVNKDSLKRLYDILSSNLLEDHELACMGDYYREDTVYILNGNIDTNVCEQGIDYHNVEGLMDKYLAYFNNNQALSDTDNYLKAQILHFYLVYIHPYFDVNGRTARTMSLWYLIKKEDCPYIIFNRGIPFHMMEYYNLIKDTKKTHDLTNFLYYMLVEVKLELEKEYLVQNIASNTAYHLESEDYQTLLYFLSIKGLRTTMDFISLYNRLNDKQKAKDIYEKMLLPLIDNDVLKVVRYTDNHLTKDIPNMVLEINAKKLDYDQNKVKRLII